MDDYEKERERIFYLLGEMNEYADKISELAYTHSDSASLNAQRIKGCVSEVVEILN
jgi:hypothetical protein